MMSPKTSSSAAAAAEIIEGNEDLLIQILILLPANSLVGFKVVSKRWRSLISSPLFCGRHTVLHHCRPGTQPAAFILGSPGSKYLVCNLTTRKLSPFPLRFPVEEIVQSCNGLLLLRRIETETCYSNRYCVFNPTTMQLRELPIHYGHVSSAYLIFDPSLSPYYRVVCFYKECLLRNTFTFYLYDSESHKWKLGEVSDDKYLLLKVEKGIIFNGGICFGRSSCYSLAHVIPESNVSEIIPSPPGHQSGTIQKNYTAESNGFLLRLTLSWENESNLLHVSEMKGIESGWTNKYQADMKPFLGEGENCVDAMDLLGVIKGEKEQDSLLLFRLKEKMMVYWFYDGVCEDVVHYINTRQDVREEKPLGFVNRVRHFVHRLERVNQTRHLLRRVNQAYHFIHSLAPV